MSSHIETAIRDVAPTIAGPLPESLRQLTERYYASSRQKITLKQHEEVARYHLCAIVAINSHSHDLNVSAPTLNNVPLPASNARQLVQLFTAQLDSKSSTTTPVGTPRKRKQSSQSPVKAAIPRTAGTTPMMNGVLATPPPKKKPRLTPKDPPSKSRTSIMRRLEAAAAAVGDSSRKPSPSKKMMKKIEQMTSTVLTPVLDDFSGDDDDEGLILQSPEKQFILLSSREITALCNKFQIEETTTKHIIETFQQYYDKVSNEWILICGLILNCYLVINHDALSSQMGAKTTTYKTMFNLQNGGLMLNDINSSIGIVKSLIEYSGWFKKLKFQHNYPEGDDSTGAFVSGSMISPHYQFHSSELQKIQNDWLDSINEVITSRREQQT